MKRNRESRSRIKLVQEKNLTKAEQRILDSTLAEQGKRYSIAYIQHRNGMIFTYDFIIAAGRGATAFRNLAVATSEAVLAARGLAKAARKIGRDAI